MDSFQKQSVNANLLYLQENLVMSEELCAGLVQYRVLPEDAVEACMAEKTTKGKISAFVTRLKKCNNVKFDTFLYVLGEVSQGHVADRLRMTESVQRDDSARRAAAEKLRTFVHDKFIHNRRFSSLEERFILENLVLKDDYEQRKVEKELALAENRKLRFSTLEKDAAIGDLNIKLGVSLRENTRRGERVAALEREVAGLEREVMALKREVDRKEAEMEKKKAEMGRQVEDLKGELDKTTMQLNESKYVCEKAEEATSWVEEARNREEAARARSTSTATWADESPNATGDACRHSPECEDLVDGNAVEEDSEGEVDGEEDREREVDGEEDREREVDGEEDREPLRQEVARLWEELQMGEDRVSRLSREVRQLLASLGCHRQHAATGEGLAALEEGIHLLEDLHATGQRPLQPPEEEHLIASLQSKLSRTRQERSKFKCDLHNLQKQLGSISVRLEREHDKVRNMEWRMRTQAHSPEAATDQIDGTADTGGIARNHFRRGNADKVTRSCVFPDLSISVKATERGRTRLLKPLALRLPAQLEERGQKRELRLLKVARDAPKRPKQRE